MARHVRKRPIGAPLFFDRVVEAMRQHGREFTSADIAARLPDMKRDTVIAFVAVAASRGHAHCVAWIPRANGPAARLYRPGPAPAGHVDPPRPARQASPDREFGTGDMIAFEQEWRARARGAARFDAALTATEAAQLRRIMNAWHAN